MKRLVIDVCWGSEYAAECFRVSDNMRRFARFGTIMRSLKNVKTPMEECYFL